MGTTQEGVDRLYEKLKREQGGSGYNLNPDVAFTKDLVDGLLVNEARYGYQSCPCRLASGERSDDVDIICPCDYRDPDVDEYGACYCGLYVSGAVVRGEQKVTAIPERRPPPEERARLKQAAAEQAGEPKALAYPVWRCGVCGYLCARDEPPEVCPICKVKRERFSRFM
jgi:ferredoxin-thioredoxin reductase catalytic chain